MRNKNGEAEAIPVPRLASAKEQKKAVHGVFADSNWGGLEVSVTNGADYLFWRENYGEPKEWHRAKICETGRGKLYFVARGRRVHLDNVLRV